MDVNGYSKYALSILFFIVLYLSYLIVKPYVLAILSAIILTYVFSPVYNLINKKITNKYLCSCIVLILIVLLVTIPSFFVLQSLATQGYQEYTVIKNTISNQQIAFCMAGETDFCTLYQNMFSAKDRQMIEDFAENSVLNAAQGIAGATVLFLKALPSKLIEFFIMIFLMFFLFIDGKIVYAKVIGLFPMKGEHQQYLIEKLKDTTDAVVFGQVFIALLQGILGCIGFWLLGVPNAILLGAIITFVGVIPFIGPTLVWVPLMIYYIIQGIETSNNFIIIKAILIALYGAIILGAVENLLKPKIIGDKAKIHPALVLIGIIGGLSLFGFIGFFVGPIILGILAALLDIYEKEKILQLKKRG